MLRKLLGAFVGPVVAPIILVVQPAWAEGPVPTKLFGIELGRIYEISEDGRLKGAPIKKFTGMRKFLGQGIHYYFEPSRKYLPFEYVEWKEENSDYFTTSFRLYLFPVIPEGFGITEDTKSEDLKWEVAVVEWAIRVEKDDQHTENDAFYWAVDMCKSVQVDLEMSPTNEINHLEANWHKCEFQADYGVLEIDSSIARVQTHSFV